VRGRSLPLCRVRHPNLSSNFARKEINDIIQADSSIIKAMVATLMLNYVLKVLSKTN
jgi:hypothetical protein